MINNLLTATLLWQVLDVVILDLVSNSQGQVIVDGTPTLATSVTIGVMCVFQFANLLLVVIMSVKLVKQVAHRSVSLWFLAQSYLSTIVLFAGLYLLLYTISDGVGFTNVLLGYTTSGSLAQVQQLVMFVRFLYFSTATMTTTGYGDIVPTVWYTSLAAVFQMLLSVMFTTIIFSKGLSHFSAPPQPGHDHQTPDSQPKAV
eukprot:TRINITY_DN7617_c0_g1_i2.p1 TRINITY_DN7617_c0_g1~~TRINITY_DN7617_c0_g1_i2.p1  ORF type:complete len:201 (+),score=36.73 TRINITY_DN7617_c0_g1_i2:217-819(+)